MLAMCIRGADFGPTLTSNCAAPGHHVSALGGTRLAPCRTGFVEVQSLDIRTRHVDECDSCPCFGSFVLNPLALTTSTHWICMNLYQQLTFHVCCRSSS